MVNAQRERRCEEIRKMHRELMRSGKRSNEAITDIEKSEENKKWCLSWGTIKQIVYDKHYPR